MAAADRNYDHLGNGKPPGLFASLPPVVRWLVIANVGFYILEQLCLGIYHFSLLDLGAFQLSESVFQGKVWQFFTFQFLHNGVVHILFNSIGLFFLGPWLERAWGSGRFLAYYLLCGVGGALFYSLLTLLNVVPDGALVGASAGIYGILIGIAVIAPHVQVRLLFPPVTLTMRQLAIGLILFSAAMIVFRYGGNEGGEAGHLGGIFMGLILAKFPWLLDWSDRGGVQIVRPKRPVRRTEAKLRPRTEVDLRTSTEIDRILDKISRDGFQALTDEERDTLQKASEAHKSKP